MLLHVDGARIANAAASLNVTLRDITKDAASIFFFGGAKNGMMYGEAVVFLRQESGKKFQIHAQAGHAPAQRCVSSQHSLRRCSETILAPKRPACESHGPTSGRRAGKIPQITITQTGRVDGSLHRAEKVCAADSRSDTFLRLDEETSESGS